MQAIGEFDQACLCCPQNNVWKFGGCLRVPTVNSGDHVYLNGVCTQAAADAAMSEFDQTRVCW